EFLIATLELAGNEYKSAERRFQWCIQAQPLVAAFHQGRGMALLGLRRPLQAVEEFCTCVRLRDDTYQTIKMLEDALLEVPGRLLRRREYVRARDLLDRYEPLPKTYRPSRRGTAWLMPGREWTSRDDALITPPYERIIVRLALALPVSEDVLATDADALEGALSSYVRITPEFVVRAEPLRRLGRRGRAPKIPLAMIRLRGVTLKPIDMAKPAELKADQQLTVRAANAYRQMGTAIRVGEATVASAGDSGVRLHGGLLPGERVGAAFADGQFAGILTARADPRADNGGASRFVDPKDLAAWAARAKRWLGSASRRGSTRGPKLKESVAGTGVPGSVFLVHILRGEKPLPKAIK
ncbi:MAG: hypothetical protein ACYS5V_08250, partial [Planctomycetota bacterium]